jgi:tRNA (uracil-5-)-methyltransferase TRM9
MDAETASRLLDLNRRFYQTFANQFSQTRQRLQPGVKRVLQTIDIEGRILDLGCGNGELGRELARRSFRGHYVGLDSGADLLSVAQKNIPEDLHASLLQADLASPDWDKMLAPASFDIILAFAVLHHLPGEQLRQQVLDKIGALLVSEGRFVHSEWQFLNSPRLSARIQPWEKIGLSSIEVDAGDYLLDWRRGGYGLRYVHHFTLDELESLAQKTGFKIVDTFYADGETGDLGLYQIWKRT